jgi:2-oxoglutarate ferredoxin oxidoreductase subunit alpha
MTITDVKSDSEGSARTDVDQVTVRMAGDSGDGMQIIGAQFTQATALAGNDLATFPDFPAEIRAPIGTTFGVSAFQIHFGARRIYTPGDSPDVLVAFNPAALKVNLPDVTKGGLIILDTGTFNKRNFAKAGYEVDPREDGSLEGFRVVEIDITQQAHNAVDSLGLTNKESGRCKNFWALGLLYWLYARDRDVTAEWLSQKFASKKTIGDANIAALNAGHAYGETMEIGGEVSAFHVPPAPLEKGLYRNITGAEALSLGLVAGASLADLSMTFCSYPITPASSVLHELAKLKNFDVATFQAEDEIAAVCAAIGASYAGGLGVTSSSGPGVALKTEAVGLAISAELPLILVNSQRAGPSTGLPTKTEQSDLYQSVFGRNADSPLIVLAARSPADCFETAIEAVKLSTKYMVPVILLSDGFIANASEPWHVPDFGAYESFPVKFESNTNGFHPFRRNEKTLARAWARPGTPGLEHRLGGIEKSAESGHISYDPENHQIMTDLRAQKVQNAVNDIPDQTVDFGPEKGRLAFVGWGSTYGPISSAVKRAHAEGLEASHIHLRNIWPLPKNLGELLKGFDRVIIPEMNNGQLVTLLRAEYLVPAEPLNQVNGRPFKAERIFEVIKDALAS